MKKILVTTDLSSSSKSAIRMAVRLAKTGNLSLSVLQVCHIPKPFSWTQHAFDNFLKEKMDKLTSKLSSFVSVICRSMRMEPLNFESVVINSLLVVDTISDYALQGKFAYILIATRGAGLVKKLFGTNTSNLMSVSEVPVISVPSKYLHRTIKTIIYATDMDNYEKELPDVISFAKILGAKIEMLSVAQPFEGINNPKQTEIAINKKFSFPIKFVQTNRDILNSLIEDIRQSLKITPYAMIALVSHRRSGFEKLFFPSNAEQFSFFAEVPLLALRKPNGA